MTPPMKITAEVELVARAIARNINQHQLDTGFAFEADFRGDLECDWQEYTSTAIAALEALEQPSSNMREAGTVPIVQTIAKQTGMFLNDEAQNVWQAMIRRALGRG